MTERKSGKEAICWGVVSLKGGTAKSTTATTLAHGLALAKRKTLLVDCDSQNQVRVLFDLENRHGLDALLLNERSCNEVIIPCTEFLHVMPAGERLSTAARAINLLEMSQEKELLRALKPVKPLYDYILFDTSPGWDIILINTLIASDHVVSPLTMQNLSVESLGKFFKRLTRFQEEREGFGVDIVLPTMYDRRLKDARSILAQLRELMPGKVATPIRKTVDVERAPSIGMSIMDAITAYSEPQGAAADYLELVKRVIEVSEHGRE